MKKQTLSWFIERINKKIYRQDLDCNYRSCKDGTDNGISIHDYEHAQYLEMVAHDLDIDYFDTPVVK